MSRPISTQLKRGNAGIGPVGAVALVVIIVLIVGGGYYAYSTGMFKAPNQANLTGGNTTITQTISNSQCVSSTPQPVTVLAGHYSGDSSISNLQWNRFTQSGQSLVQTVDSPGTVTDGTKSSASSNPYSIGPSAQGLSIQGPTWEQITQSSSPNAYPMWVGPTSASLLTNPITEFGQTVFSVSCVPSSSNSAASNWAMSGILFEAPSSFASATTNGKATMVYPGGASAPSAFPTAATTWNWQLLDYSNYKAAGLPYPECGTQANPVTNYATGTTYTGCPQGPGQGGLPTSGLVGIIASNVTGISISLPQGYTLTPISGVPSGDKAWTVTSTGLPYLNGCAPAPSTGVSSSNAYVCENIPVTIYETATQGSKVGSVAFGLVDFQQAAFIQNNFNIPSPTTYTSTHWAGATGSAAGLPTGFTTLTPTSSINSGNPSPLVNQWYTFEGTY